MDAQSFVSFGEFQAQGMNQPIVLPHYKEQNCGVSYPYNLPVQRVYESQPFNTIHFQSYEPLTTITEIKEPESCEKIYGYEKTLAETKNNPIFQQYAQNYAEVMPSIYLNSLNGDFTEYNNLQFVTNSKIDAGSELLKGMMQLKPEQINQDYQDKINKNFQRQTIPNVGDPCSKTLELKEIMTKQPQAFIPSEFKCSFPSETFPRHPSYEILAWQMNSGIQQAPPTEQKEKKKRNFFLGKTINSSVLAQSDKSFQPKSKASAVPLVNKDELKLQKNSQLDKTSFSFFSCCNKKKDEMKDIDNHEVLKTCADESAAKLAQVVKTQESSKLVTKQEKTEEKQIIKNDLKEKSINEEIQKQNTEKKNELFEKQLEKNKLKEQLEILQLKEHLEKQQLNEELEKQQLRKKHNEIKYFQNFVPKEIDDQNLKKVIKNQIKEALESQYREEAREYERIIEIMQNQCIQQQRLTEMLEQQRDKQRRLIDDLEQQLKSQERLTKAVEQQSLNKNVQQKAYIQEDKTESTSKNSDPNFFNSLEEQIKEYSVVLDKLKQQEKQYQELNEKLKWQEQLSQKFNDGWSNFFNQNEALQFQKIKLYNSLKNVQEQLRLHIKCLYNFKHNKLVQETDEVDELLRNFCISAAEVLKQNTDGLNEQLPDIELIETPDATKRAIQAEKKKRAENRQDRGKLEKEKQEEKFKKKLDEEMPEKGSQIKVKRKKKIDPEKTQKKAEAVKATKLSSGLNVKARDASKQIKKSTKYVN